MHEIVWRYLEILSSSALLQHGQECHLYNLAELGFKVNVNISNKMFYIISNSWISRIISLSPRDLTELRVLNMFTTGQYSEI